MIPKHQRANYEATEFELAQLRSLLIAAECLAENPLSKSEGSEHADALSVLYAMAIAKLSEVDRAHSAEWVGIGGKASNLTEAEIATASGEYVKA